MSISNTNLRAIIRLVVVLLALVALTDLVLLFWAGDIITLFQGYSALLIPAILFGTYAYLGLPIFHFDADSTILHIKSHMALGNIFGKELYILKKNIIGFEIDTVRIRKKLTVHYLKDGKEFKEKFSISLLSNKKIEKLAKQVDLIQTENGWSNNSHLFI